MWQPLVGESPDERIQYVNLRTQFERFDFSDHLALFYRCTDEQFPAIAAYLDQGLGNDEQCVYIADENDPDDVVATLSAFDIDVETRREQGDLQVVTAREAYGTDEQFDPDEMLGYLREATADSVGDDYDGLRVVGENTWYFGFDVPFEDILAFEASFDDIVDDVPCRTICQYNLERFDPDAVVDVLETHEHVLYDGVICQNPLYEAPAEYPKRDLNDSKVEHVLSQTRQLSLAQQRTQSQEERLTVLNRILRHNIRNETNGALGYLEHVADRIDDETTLEYLANARAHVAAIHDISERIRRVEQRLAADVCLSPVDVSGAVSNAVASVADRHPDARLDVDCPAGVTAIGGDDVAFAIRELLVEAIRRSETAAPTVNLSVAVEDATETVEISVSGSGTPLDPDEREALQRGFETQLVHASGIDLWAVKWVVERSGGTLVFPPESATEFQLGFDLPLYASSVPA